MIAACLAQPLAGQATDSLALSRRVVAAASLAAKEYALGVVPAGGQITQPEEIDEAKLFIQQARFDVSGLPLAARSRSERTLARLAQMLDSLAPPDSVARMTDSLVALVTAAAGGPKVVEPLPSRPPSLARGANTPGLDCGPRAYRHGVLDTFFRAFDSVMKPDGRVLPDREAPSSSLGRATDADVFVPRDGR